MPGEKPDRPGTPIFVAFAIMLTLVLAGGLILYGNGRTLVDNADWVSHTREVQSELDGVSFALTSALSSERAYLLSRGEEHLSDYHDSLLEAKRRLEGVRTMTADNPTQQERLVSLHRLASQMVAEMESGLKAGSAGPRLAHGRETLLLVRDAVSKMQRQESLLLDERIRDSRSSLERAVLAFWGGLAVQILALIGLLLLTTRVIRILARSRNAELQHRAELERRVEQRTAELRASNEELESFSGAVSHDLRAPLRHISATASILRDELKPKLTRDEETEFEQISKEVRRMGQLIEDLLQLSRTARGTIQYAKIDLSQMANEVLQSLTERNLDRSFDCTVQSGMQVEGDARMVRILLENLCSNAAKYSSKSPSPRVEVGETKLNGERAFFVKDNGVGFDPALKPKLFETFSRLHSEREFEGSGLGLAICKKIVTRHGGRIWAEAEPGKGATFCFTLQPTGR